MAKANEGGMTSLKFNMGETDEKKEDVKMTGKMNPQDVFPCLLAMCGSGMAWMKVNEDATFQIIDGSNRGGRYFMATGALMIGATSYEELTSLAEKGNPNNVHYTNIDIVRESQDQSDEQKEAGGLYSLTSEKQDENYLYLMGKAMGKSRDDFSREDIAAAHLQAFTSDLCQGLELCMRGENIKHVFWCGSFIKAEIIRRYLTLEWRRRAMNVLMMTGKSSPSELHFLKHGPYLGALGCVINSVSQFLKPPSEAAAETKAKESPEDTKM